MGRIRSLGVVSCLLALLVLSGCPTEGVLGELTFEQRNDGLHDRTLDYENDDDFLIEGRWSVGAYLSIEVDTADPSDPLPVMECASEDQTVFASTMVGADFIDLDVVGEDSGVAIECYRSSTGEIIDFINMNAAFPAALAVLHRVPLASPRFALDVTGLTLQMLEGGAIDVALGIRDDADDHLRGNVGVDILGTDPAIVDLVCDTVINDNCEANQFWVLLAGVAGAADIDVALTTDATVGALIPVDVFPEIDLTELTAAIYDADGNKVLTSAAPSGAVLIASALLADQSEVWGGDYAFDNQTPAIIELFDPIEDTPSNYAKVIGILDTGMASVIITLNGSTLPGVQIDFPVTL